MRLIVLFSGAGDRGTEAVTAVRKREAVLGAAGYCLPSVRLYTAKCEIEY